MQTKQKQKRLTIITMAVTLIASLAITLFVAGASAATVETSWIRQFGPTWTYQFTDIDSDGNIYVGGMTDETTPLPGQVSNGGIDVFVRKYDSAGTEQWTRQYGTGEYDYSEGLAVDSTGVYLFGMTTGQLPGNSQEGASDGFIIKYDLDGNQDWVRSFGTSGNEVVWSGAVDSSGVYAVGSTRGSFDGFTNNGGYDAFITKYDSDGNQIWLDQFGTDSPSDDGYAIHADSGGVYVGGGTGSGTTQALGSTNYGGGDAFIRKYTSGGTEQWTRQFGTADYDQVFTINSDDTGIYVAGETYDSLVNEAHTGDADVFLRKYDSDGNAQWTNQFGSSSFDTALGIAANTSGVYVSGSTYGTLDGQTSSGGEDGYVSKFNSSGEPIWTFQFGTSQDDQVQRIIVDSAATYLSGRTSGSLPGQTSSGGVDAFVIRIGQDDFDSDGIFDAIDLQTSVFSNEYSDGTTSGVITERGDQVIQIEDATNPADGVLISAGLSGGPSQATAFSCGVAETLLDPGDAATVTCGSAIIKVESGEVETVFTADNGTVASTSLSSGNEVTFTPEDATIAAAEENTEPIEVVVDGSTVVVEPGEVQPVFLEVTIDLKPGSSQNKINLKSKGVIPVAIFGSSELNIDEIDQLSLELEGAGMLIKGNGEVQRKVYDYNDDGILDLLIFAENKLEIEETAETVELTGFTHEGVPFAGTDAIQVVH